MSEKITRELYLPIGEYVNFNTPAKALGKMDKVEVGVYKLVKRIIVERQPSVVVHVIKGSLAKNGVHQTSNGNGAIAPVVFPKGCPGCGGRVAKSKTGRKLTYCSRQCGDRLWHRQHRKTRSTYQGANQA